MSDIITVQVTEVIKQTADAITIHFAQPSEKIEYVPGQFLTLIDTIEGEEVRRAYSLCSSPYTDEHLAVTVKRVKGGKMSNFLIDNLKAGTEMQILPAMGNFICNIDKDFQRNVVLLGGGSGITPLLSIMKSVLAEEVQSVVSLVYANSTEGDIIFKETLDQLKETYKERLRVYHYLSGAERAVQKKGFLGLKKKVVMKQQGRLTPEALNAILDGMYIQSGDAVDFYICGPNGLMDTAEKAVLKRGIEKKYIHKESFYTDGLEKKTIKTEGEKGLKLIVGGDEHELTLQGKESILTEVLAQGVEAPFSCQSGLCTACMGKCTSGEVKMDFEDALTPDQIADGYVLTCIGHVVSEEATIEFE